MLMMLTGDRDVFEKQYSGAANFVRAAELRFECYHLCQSARWNDWERERVKSLLRTPACCETWFTRKLRDESANNEVARMLIEMGL